jgi:hypothetical protein
MLFWRGWGILVFFVPFLWIFILAGVLIGSGAYEPDPVKASAAIDRLFALAFALAGASVFLIVRYRARKGINYDDFMFIRMKYWAWLLGLVALGLVVASFVAVGA